MTKKITKWEPEDFELEMTTHWSFPKRGNWATERFGFLKLYLNAPSLSIAYISSALTAKSKGSKLNETSRS